MFRKRGDGKNNFAYIAILPRALANACLTLKTTFSVVYSKLLMPEFKYQDCLKFYEPQAPLVRSVVSGLCNSSFSSSARFLLTYTLPLPC